MSGASMANTVISVFGMRVNILHITGLLLRDFN